MGSYSGNDVFHESIFIPDDNSKPKAATFNLTNEPVIDNIRYLKNRGMPAGTGGTALSSGVVTPGGGASVGVQGTAWQDFPSADGLIPFVQFTGVTIGDVIVVHFSAALSLEGQDEALVQLVAVQDFGGTNVSAQVPGAIARVQRIEPDVIATAVTNVHLVGRVSVTVAGTLRIKLQGQGTVVSPAKVGVFHDYYYTLMAERFRPY